MLKEHQARLRPVLDRFKETNDLPGLTSLYRSVRALQPSPMHEGIYAYFINAFLSFWRSQDMALRVWEDMIMGGITPTAKSWNALLRYGHGRDRTALLAIWKRMVLTGVVPDVYCWTTRIHLQMLADEVQDGLESFEQMIEAGVKPTIETINAAMDGLLSFNRFDEIDHVVSMADHLGVPANIITYNTLLRGMLRRRGAATEVIPLLESMHSRGISPDVYTFTIALDGLYKAARSLPNPDAPSFSYILELFRYMEGLGIDANVTTYTALVGGLLDTGNLAAVDVVRRVMARKGVVGNADFYTVLIKSAFQRCDIGAADRYADEITHLRVRRDHIFWMELIWGYAQFGETVKMAAAIDAMKREPVRMVITLKGHVTILRALERRGERIVAKGIIEDVVKEWEAPPRLPDAPDAPSKVEMEFWSVVAKIGGTGWMAALREEAGRREARDREEIARDHLARVVDIVGVREERNV
ncbi:hypothetical protein BZA05DRAFT_332386 [Tricharina praecox]|uniref:uncharacterized protein n=1 Tax=Tricharina praecox TaxID=43433 RepID=UPI00221F100B|nr:uncharacterized protein BZA05DRAFT_332386 [Tricharina praecox]KAI5857051.1 hypothetical protein BZA05DRAFT_332386 [Tricharina praecox]